MSVTWRTFMANDWNLQVDQSLMDRVYAMMVIRKTNGGSQTYHATVLLDNIEYCPYAVRDGIVIEKQVLDTCREMIHNFNDFWFNSEPQ